MEAPKEAVKEDMSSEIDKQTLLKIKEILTSN